MKKLIANCPKLESIDEVFPSYCKPMLVIMELEESFSSRLIGGGKKRLR
jgi:hypothetical protein